MTRAFVTLVVVCLAATASAQNIVKANQGAPGSQGSWPVKIPAQSDGGAQSFVGIVGSVPTHSVVITQSDGGIPTAFATQSPSLFTACNCASALVNDGGTLPVGAFLALTNNGDGGQPTTCGCEFVQPGTNVSAQKYWWTMRDGRDTITLRVLVANLASGNAAFTVMTRETGVVQPGDFNYYTGYIGGSTGAITAGIGAKSISLAAAANSVALGRGGESAFIMSCSPACVASNDGGTVQVRMSVWE